MGYMGCGKSALGKNLTQSKRFPFIDLDDYIESQEKISISEMFEKYGELHFRKKERFYLEKLLSDVSPSIIALGGGTPCYFDNIDFINQNKNLITVYLKTTPNTLAKRLFDQKDNRPMIDHLNTPEELEQFIAKHLFERVPYYIKAQHQIVTDDQSIGDLSQQVEKILT
jgi:shikimate kinase